MMEFEDDWAEVHVLCGCILGRKLPEWVSEENFQHGSKGFNGWLFTQVREASEQRVPIHEFLLSDYRKSMAADKGEHNIVLAVAEILYTRSGCGRGSLTSWNLALRRLRNASQARAAYKKTEERMKQIKTRWMDYETSPIKNIT
jgi:hypothetical protein